MESDKGLDALLDLNGYIIDQDLGCWIKVEAWQVEASPEIPRGIRYSLTLHGPYGKRITGYDNSHAIKPTEEIQVCGTAASV